MVKEIVENTNPKNGAQKPGENGGLLKVEMLPDQLSRMFLMISSTVSL